MVVTAFDIIGVGFITLFLFISVGVVIGITLYFLHYPITTLSEKEKKHCPDEKTLVHRRLRKAQWMLISKRMGRINWTENRWVKHQKQDSSMVDDTSLYTTGVVSLLDPIVVSVIREKNKNPIEKPLILMDENREKLEALGFQISECGKKAIYSGSTKRELSKKEKELFDFVHEKLVKSQWALISRRMAKLECRTTTMFQSICDFFTSSPARIYSGHLCLSISWKMAKQATYHEEEYEKDSCAMPLLSENRKRLEEMGFEITPDGTEAFYKTEHVTVIKAPEDLSKVKESLQQNICAIINCLDLQQRIEFQDELLASYQTQLKLKGCEDDMIIK